MPSNAQQVVSSLMEAYRNGNTEAGAQLMELFYPELKRLAASHLQRERQGHSWQPTLLVNELYLQIVKVKALPPEEAKHSDDKAAFFALASQLMRWLLISHTRPLSQKAIKVPVWEDLCVASEACLLEIENLLLRLERMDPLLRTVVELKVFHGYTAAEIAQQLRCSPVTVNRHWQFARHWMREQI